MDEKKMYNLAERFLGAWNTQDVARVVAVYTDDATYVDPNTRGPVRGADALRRYLTKLFGRWKMRWSLREAYLLDGRDGCAVLWHATFQKPEGGQIVEADGMDFVKVRNERIERNEVYFDRAVLAPLLAIGA
ncbi:MAG: nuclear transport factor 2 family protein [Candidatus Abyssobacteria bacterium SURF_17]|uniref:Nuclear transport factor 2 family protein n=1 Tax=Candidatus Abyssobacteria bacterium SURF_17 TaxID=2093361 RepID=A0A419ESQ2_9BACT|nr:MAG: nuclear transport factor 2 family protein [Candidatus Abyssubacteria bacterium SURF_17]